ncbi:MAG TPA: DEAD/DEAH box helicase family protein [Candidatus Woesebacteria bacterium]|nr:DEAD/DEAH box helicase family protein [Candidatus Woesebacteria bacterium]
MTFNKILDRFRSESFSERDKGFKFERLIQAYLYTDPKYTHLQKIWLWGEFPFRSSFGGQDVGIDLVAKTFEGEYWAIQCKCYQEDNRINKEEVDTFLATSSRSFKDEQLAEIKFSHCLWVSTTNNWSSNANESLQNQNPPVTRINLSDLQEASVDWSKISEGMYGEKARTPKKQLKYHQKEALDKAINYFKNDNRGKLIMACGTGKTFTSLKIAEELTNHTGTILFLVPSIALLGQSLREWTSDAAEEINPIAICSDSEITKDKKKNEDTDTYSVVDLAIPASTNMRDILKQFEYFEMAKKKGLTVVFSTYQSIDVISQTQKRLESIGSKYQKFDLIVCDEAHRTTGVTISGEDESSFVKVHDNAFINADKRIYMTATPRLYGEESKRKAEETSAVLCSMDDEALYGKEIYRIGFGEAVERDLLSDYKVLILTLSENDVTPEVQKILQNPEHEIGVDDASKLIGCINAMSKQIISDKGTVNTNDPDPMRRAVAFTSSIKISKKITDSFNEIGETYAKSVPELKQQTLVNLNSKHIDGSMSATDRNELMSWLKAEPNDSQEARVLTNVRCLSEGVDVPTLDAVMFLSAKNSQIDVVQSVGRVMRKSPGKQYGYIIIPIVIPTDVKPEDALKDNDRYKVVWTVLNALRAHDDRFNAIVNKIDLNKNRPVQIIIGRPDPDGDGDPFNDSDESKKALKGSQLALQFDQLQNAIYAKMVQKVGDRQYWENWAKSVADIAERQIVRITKIVDEDDSAHMGFREFVRGLRKNINPSITEQQAIEMLSQHIITKPVFEALFEGYSFVSNNAVSISMQKALDAIETKAIEDVDAELLQGFYKSVRKRAEGIDNSEGKQRIIVELYDKFFKTAFPKLVEQLGIVYTPVEVVDFIIHSINDVLQNEFGRSLSDENVNILDPFTGTGTFITRLLQTGVIKHQDLERKYKGEIFANEIVLLAYYIAAVNIENAYHDLLKKDVYESFEGIVLTDTFQLSEDGDNEKLFCDALAENSERLERQKNTPLKVIMGNPPYSVGQTSANDASQNQSYPKLENRIGQTYVSQITDNTLKQSLYDAYIKAFRWATDRLDKDGGIICFVSNGAWLDGKATSGFRKTIENEFTSVYVFNLRGNQRTNGEESRREGGKIFGSGSRTPISITLLVKNPNKHNDKAEILYHDIGDYLSREEKLKIISDFKTVSNQKLVWKTLNPNNEGDWINKRHSIFDTYVELGSKAKNKNSCFDLYSAGVITHRDAWVYDFSEIKLEDKLTRMISFYNSEAKKLQVMRQKNHRVSVEKSVNKDSKLIKWDRRLYEHADKSVVHTFNSADIYTTLYRPFSKQHYYFNKNLSWSRYLQPKLFPYPTSSNLVICTTGPGANKDFSALMSNVVTDFHTLMNNQSFPLYYYEKNEQNIPSLFDLEKNNEYNKRDSISDYVLRKAQTQYSDNEISKEDIFYYIYGLLHSMDYRIEFANDLKKMSPKIPLVETISDFKKFSKAGRKLGELHVNYEKVPPYEGVRVSGTQHNNYLVEKLKFIKKGQRDTIIFNNQIKIENIPEIAYKYVVNGKSAIEWIVEKYQIKTDKESGIVNDPNDWAKEVGNPRYILDLLLSVINLSVQTVDIVNSLPKLSFDTGTKE